MSLADNFNNEIHSIESRFSGGLSNTSTKKFDELIKIVAEISGVEEEKIYITAATSRASNLWNRLAQGKPLTQHFSLALGIIDVSDLQGGISPATRFIGVGVGHYDAIALAVKRNNNWMVGAVLDTDTLPIYDKFVAAFPNADISHEHLSADDYANVENEIEFAWYVGTTGNDVNGEWHDYSDEYIEQGTWINGWNDKFLELVKTIQVGDRIAIKSVFNQKNNLPFDNRGKKVGAMRLKAIGIVTENIGDGKQLKVEWERLDPAKTWYGPGTLRETIHKVVAKDGYVKKQLLDFTFGDIDQDYSICEEYYTDDIDADLQTSEALDSDELSATELTRQIDESTRLKHGKNILLYGVPGCGKSYTIKNKYCKDADGVERVVFHPDYTYGDFVGQIMPVTDKKTDRIKYEFTPGPFTRILSAAYNNPTKKYCLVVEEINRGNAPAIFGDIFQLLDREEDGSGSYDITNVDVAEKVYIYNRDSIEEPNKIKIPSNLFIFATMNTSDQNVFTLDTAFQRRWNMRMIENDVSQSNIAGKKILDTSVKWSVFNKTINDLVIAKNIGMTSSEDKRLGAYFVTENDLYFFTTDDGISQEEADDRNHNFPEKVLKYLWDDAFKFTRDEVFKSEYDSLEKLIKAFETAEGDKRFYVFLEDIFSLNHEE